MKSTGNKIRNFNHILYLIYFYHVGIYIFNLCSVLDLVSFVENRWEIHDENEAT